MFKSFGKRTLKTTIIHRKLCAKLSVHFTKCIEGQVPSIVPVHVGSPEQMEKIPGYDKGSLPYLHAKGIFKDTIESIKATPSIADIHSMRAEQGWCTKTKKNTFTKAHNNTMPPWYKQTIPRRSSNAGRPVPTTLIQIHWVSALCNVEFLASFSLY